MITRSIIAIAACACVLQSSRLHAQSQGPDNFIPTQPPKSGADANAAESRAFKYVLLLPNEKSSESVKDAERNPFGRSDDELHDVGGKSSNEETKIQEQLAKLRATGLSPGPNGLRVLLGDMCLSKNDIMPAVVKDQTLALRVNELTRDAIHLVWLENKFTGLPPRFLIIPVDLRATVRRVPHGQLPEKSETKTESRASKRATAVELPAPIAARTNPAEARKPAQLALSPMPPPATETKVAKDAMIITAAPGVLPGLGRKVTPPEIAGPPAPPAPPAESTTPEVATQTPAAEAMNPPLPALTEPAAWKRAMGLMDNIVKLSEANK